VKYFVCREPEFEVFCEPIFKTDLLKKVGELKVGLGILQITSAKRCPQVWPWFGRSLFSTDFVEFDQAV